VERESRLAHLADKERRALIDFLVKLYQRFDGRIQFVTLFGSRARGDAEPDSDMDVLVVLDSEDPQARREIRYLAAEVWLEHGLYLSTRVWSLAHWQKLRQMEASLYRNICHDGIDLRELYRAEVLAEENLEDR